MPWHIVSEHSECPASRPWAVVKDSDGEVEGCHETEEDAQAQIAALNANESEASSIGAAFRRGCDSALGRLIPDGVDAGTFTIGGASVTIDGDGRTLPNTEEGEMTAPPIELAVDPEIDHACVDDGDGTCEECGRPCEEHPTATDEQQEQARTANEVRFVGIAAVLDYETADGRLIESRGFTVRPTPLPLMYQDTNPMMGGHEGAVLAGRIEEVAVEDRRVWISGAIDLHALARNADDPDAIVEAIRSQTARFVSVDLSDAEVDYEVRSVDEDGWPVEVLARFHDAMMAGATVTPFPAIPDAVIWLDGETEPTEATAALPDPPEPVEQPEVVDEPGGLLILASAADLPPESAFRRSALHDRIVMAMHEQHRSPHVRIADDGRVYGYIAPWGVCHTGLPGCTVAPQSATGLYAYYLTAATAVACDCGDDDEHAEEIATGVLTWQTGHAGTDVSPQMAMAHYDNTGTAWADVTCGEDEHGIWIAGWVRPGLSDDDRRVLDGSNLSGDWRPLGGNLELIASLSVNVPGFPMVPPQTRLVASALGTMEVAALVAPFTGGDEALVAGGGRTLARSQGDHVLVPRAEWRALQARLAQVEAIAAALRGQAADALAASLGG